jgi:hypothetical protein
MVFVFATVLVLSLLGILFNLFKRQQVGRPSNLKYYALGSVALLAGLSILFCRNGTLILAIICMTFSFLGMLYCAKMQKAYAYAQPIAITLLSVVLVCMVIILGSTMGSGDISRIIRNEMKFAQAGAYIMGKTLAEKYPERVALVIVSPEWQKDERMKSMVEALKEGIGSTISLKAVDAPIPPPIERTTYKDESGNEIPVPEDMLMMEEMLQAKQYNELIDRYRECNLLVFMVPLPSDMVNLSIWEMREEERPMVALLFSDIYSLQRAIKAGLVIAMGYKPGIKFRDDPPPSDRQAAFDERYVIIAPDNIDDFVQKNPGFFQDVK